ncbi:unnamed protein product [Amoebophrya sp. A120]|nr:unnamed protein product [Amoebophrya sp. A120]|eukprot:GSA120T00019884001.1
MMHHMRPEGEARGGYGGGNYGYGNDSYGYSDKGGGKGPSYDSYSTGGYQQNGPSSNSAPGYGNSAPGYGGYSQGATSTSYPGAAAAAPSGGKWGAPAPAQGGGKDGYSPKSAGAVKGGGMKSSSSKGGAPPAGPAPGYSAAAGSYGGGSTYGATTSGAPNYTQSYGPDGGYSDGGYAHTNSVGSSSHHPSPTDSGYSAAYSQYTGHYSAPPNPTAPAGYPPGPPGSSSHHLNGGSSSFGGGAAPGYSNSGAPPPPAMPAHMQQSSHSAYPGNYGAPPPPGTTPSHHTPTPSTSASAPIATVLGTANNPANALNSLALQPPAIPPPNHLQAQFMAPGMLKGPPLPPLPGAGGSPLDSKLPGFYDASNNWIPKYMGYLKSYNKAQGYGFIYCLETHKIHNQDVFIHKAQVEEKKDGEPEVGQWVEFVVKTNERGQPQARNVVWLPGRIDPSQMEGAAGKDSSSPGGKSKGGTSPKASGGKSGAKTPGATTSSENKDAPKQGAANGSSSGKGGEENPENKVYHGSLKSFSQNSGYGFIHCQQLWDLYKRDVYVHKSEMPGDGDPRTGITCDFQATLNPKGQPQAKNVIWNE